MLAAVRTRQVLFSFMEHGSMTVSQLQEVLGWPSKSLYYQVRKLVDAGLLVEAGSTLVHGKEAVVYAPIAEEYGWPDGYQGLEYERLTARWVKRSLMAASRRFESAAERSASDPSLIDDQLFLSLTLRLSPKDRARFKTRLRELLGEFKGKQVAEADRQVALTLVISPDPEP